METEITNERYKFTFYRSFFNALQDADDETQFRLYKAIAVYALSKEEPILNKGLESMAWKLIKPVLDADWQRYDNGCNGGAPIGNTNAQKQPKNNRKTTEKQPTLSIDIKNKENKENNKEITIVPKKKISLPIEQRKEEFKESITQYREKYDPDLLNDFFAYWTEPTPDKKKMRFELEKTWSTGGRLSYWKRRAANG